jgi:2-iminobutanoate/2-iminopropanoate deaminase
MRTAINSGDYHVPLDGFSQIVLTAPSDRMAYVSGLTARNKDGTIVGVGDMGAQTRQVLENITTVLSAVQSTLDDVVQIRSYVTDISRWDEIEPVWREYWGDGPWPASTMVQVSQLFDPQLLIEIDVVATVPG